MKEYVCPLCNKDFKKKSHYVEHVVNKKKPCKPFTPKHSKIGEMGEKDLQKSPENGENSLLETMNINNSDKNNDIICSFCNKTFVRKDGLNRHLDGRCKEKKSKDELQNLKNICYKALDELEKCKNEIAILKSSNQDINKINNVNNTNNTMNTMNKNSHNITNNTLNNTTTLNSNNMNSNNNITIVQFGKEDLSKMNLEEMMKIYLKSTGGNIIANMLKYINLNPEYPENNNIFMTDLAREIVRIHDGKKFVSKKFKNIKDNIINNVSTHITDIFYKYDKNKSDVDNLYKKVEAKIDSYRKDGNTKIDLTDLR